MQLVNPHHLQSIVAIALLVCEDMCWGTVCVHVVCFPVRPRHAGHLLQCGSLQFLFGSFFLQFLHCSTCRHGPVIMYWSHLHVAFVFSFGEPAGLFCGTFPSSGW